MDFTRIAREYSELRSASVQLSGSLTKQLQPADIGEAARDLGVLHGKFIDLETEGELAVVADYAIHDIRHDGLNAVDRLLRDAPPPEGSAEMRLLRSMQHAFFTMYTPESVEPGVGVHVLEGIDRSPCFIADFSFSRSCMPGSMLIGRLHSPGKGWYMTTGAVLPVPPAAVQGIKQDLRAYIQGHGADSKLSALSSMLLRNCIAAGASRSIAYASIDGKKEPPKPLNASNPRIGRNEPCPCGRGNKYKKCCGR